MRAIAVRAGFAIIPHMNAKTEFKPAPTQMRAIAVRAGFATIPHINAKSQFKPALTHADLQ